MDSATDLGDEEDDREVLPSVRRYYDDFSATYEARRGGRGRYHDLLDDLEVELARPHVRGRRVLEVGCGTGLILRRLSGIADRAIGVDLSPGMLSVARARGLEVVEGDAYTLPFDDESFDAVVSFKTLAHVPDLRRALGEMARVTRPGGVIIAEVYNPHSLRLWIKRLFPPGRVGRGTEQDVPTRFDAESDVRRVLPRACTIEAARGIRTVLPGAFALEVPVVGTALERIERRMADTRIARRLGGFVCWVLRKS